MPPWFSALLYLRAIPGIPTPPYLGLPLVFFGSLWHLSLHTGFIYTFIPILPLVRFKHILYLPHHIYVYILPMRTTLLHCRRLLLLYTYIFRATSLFGFFFLAFLNLSFCSCLRIHTYLFACLMLYPSPPIPLYIRACLYDLLLFIIYPHGYLLPTVLYITPPMT